ncbi:MAG: hypothetical protein ACREQA_11635 [Candidatus Binatia bacterium]
MDIFMEGEVYGSNPNLIAKSLKAGLTGLQTYLEEKGEVLEEADSTLRGLLETLNSRIEGLKNQVIETARILAVRDTEPEEKSSLIEAKEEEMSKLEDQKSAEIKRLKVQLHEKDALLEAGSGKGVRRHNGRWKSWQQGSHG